MNNLDKEIDTGHLLIALRGVILNMECQSPYKKSSREDSIYKGVLESFKENFKSILHRLRYKAMVGEITEEDIMKILKAEKS